MTSRWCVVSIFFFNIRLYKAEVTESKQCIFGVKILKTEKYTSLTRLQ